MNDQSQTLLHLADEQEGQLGQVLTAGQPEILACQPSEERTQRKTSQDVSAKAHVAAGGFGHQQAAFSQQRWKKLWEQAPNVCKLVL
jgi:hypothetical protein